MFDSEVLVIGAGPGGSVAARLLARRGVGVTLVEQHGFPRDKVCGECVSALGLDVLRREGLLERVRAAGAVSMNRCALHAPNGQSVWMELPGAITGLSRRVLDSLLLEAAREAGAEIWQPARCEGVGGEVVVRDLASNATHRRRPACVIVADGRGALLPGRRGLTGDLGIKAHFADIDAPRDGVEIFGLSGHYGGLAPIEDGLWNVCLSVPEARLRACGDVQGVFEAILGENRQLQRRMRGARRVGRWLAAGLPRYGVRRDWPEGVIPIGNSAAALEPIGGEGMGLALRSAELAGEAVAKWLLEGAAWPGTDLARRFRRLWRVRRAACRLAAVVSSRPRLCGWSVEMLRCCPGAGAAALGWMGKAELAAIS